MKVYLGNGTPTVVDFMAYAAGTWGVNVRAADVDGADDEILTGPGPGDVLGPQVRAFRRDGTAIAKVNFYAYGTLKYGVNVAGGSVDSDAFGSSSRARARAPCSDRTSAAGTSTDPR
ncbi:MAG: hypothetical protein U0166_19345 [Acidobacteriota bacterium]